MTQDLSEMKRRLGLMMAISCVFTFIAVGFAVAHFMYSVSWAIWGFVGFLAVGFAVQLWFIRGIARNNRGG